MARVIQNISLKRKRKRENMDLKLKLGASTRYQKGQRKKPSGSLGQTNRQNTVLHITNID